jgi:hypothetical protein
MSGEGAPLREFWQVWPMDSWSVEGERWGVQRRTLALLSPICPLAPVREPASVRRSGDMRLLPEATVWPVQKITLRPAHGLPMLIVPRCCM